MNRQVLCASKGSKNEKSYPLAWTVIPLVLSGSAAGNAIINDNGAREGI